MNKIITTGIGLLVGTGAIATASKYIKRKHEEEESIKEVEKYKIKELLKTVDNIYGDGRRYVDETEPMIEDEIDSFTTEYLQKLSLLDKEHAVYISKN